jgi:hypothetical protein
MREHRHRSVPILTIACSAVIRSNTTMLFTVFGAAFGMQLYVANEQDTRMGRMLIWGDRAFDTGSEKVWNTLNKGVRKMLAFAMAVANAPDSVNGRTSSRGTWRRPRTMTSRAATHGQSEHDTFERCDICRRALYIRVYSTAAKYQDKILIPQTKPSLCLFGCGTGDLTYDTC